MAAHRRPQPEYQAGPLAAAAGATAMIDISDGLVQDLGHIAAASGVCIDLRTACLPVAPALRLAASELGTDWLGWALTGGEDHALAATFADTTDVAARHGQLSVASGPEPASWWIRRPGRRPAGWDHFRKSARLSAGCAIVEFLSVLADHPAS